MNLPAPIDRYLRQQGVPYRLISVPPGEALGHIAESLGVPAYCVMRIVLLQDAAERIMVVLPSNYILDFSTLCDVLQRDLEPLHGAEAAAFFKAWDCKPRSYPPLPAVFEIPALVDNYVTTMADEDEVYFDGGSGDVFVAMRSVDFRRLLATARWEHFSVPLEHLDTLMREGGFSPEHLTRVTHRYTPIGLGKDVESITDLPQMSEIAQYILALRENPEATTRDILRIVEQDPSLAAQVIYWARSPLHGYHGAIDSLRTAVESVLGFENTLNLLLGSCMSRAFTIPPNGPLGLEAFWRHSVYCGALVSELVRLLPQALSVKPGLAYLGGLLHNFGYLVLGHLFPARFFLFNRFLAVNPQAPLSTIERYVLGVEHWHIGAWLMQAWSLPEEVVAAVRWHHNEDCTQPHAEYSNLVLIADRLLHHIGMSESENSRLPTLALFTLGITREQAMTALARIEYSRSDLDALSDALRLPSQE